MKTLPSVLFSNCEFSGDKDVGFYDLTPKGFDHPISVYLGIETVKDDAAISKAGAFFDKVSEHDAFCRSVFNSVSNGSEDKTVIEYFDFYKDELPEIFNASNVSDLSLENMIKCLKLSHMSTHGSGSEQYFVVDFTLGYDQLLCAYFNCNGAFDHIAWES